MSKIQSTTPAGGLTNRKLVLSLFSLSFLCVNVRDRYVCCLLTCLFIFVLCTGPFPF